MILYMVAVVAMAVVVRYQLGLSDACETIGKVIDDAGTRTDVQDALTPPKSTILAMVDWAASAVLIAAVFWQFGIYAGLISVGVFVVAAILAGATLIPAPESSHYVRIIVNSLSNRHAGFVESGDRVRAGETAELLGRLQSRYSKVLGE